MKPYFEIVSPAIIGKIEKASEFFGSLSSIGAITLFPFIISKHPMNEALRVHEETHIYQQVILPIPVAVLSIVLAILVSPWFLLGLICSWTPYLGVYYIVYAIEYMLRLRHYKDGVMAYRMISFEQQAYDTTVATGPSWNPLGWIRAMFVW